MSEIKNCPFCGAEPHYDDDEYEFYARHTPRCFLYQSLYSNRIDDRDAWNARVLPPEVERLVKAVETHLFDERREPYRDQELKDALAALKEYMK